MDARPTRPAHNPRNPCSVPQIGAPRGALPGLSGSTGASAMRRSCGCNTAGLTFRPDSLSPFDLASDYLTITY
jgi:hypothetical protein